MEALRILWTFLRFGLVGFGGPPAHLALFERALVTQAQWVSKKRLMELISIANLLPGPTSTEVAMLLGRERAGFLGLVAAGIGFILPGALLCAGLAWLVTQGAGTEWRTYLWALVPMALALVGHALWSLSRSTLTGLPAAVACALAGGLSHAGLTPPLALLAGALFFLGLSLPRRPQKATPLLESGSLLLAAGNPSFWGITLVFLKTGALLFGGGYVLLSFLQDELVWQRGWLTLTQVNEGIAMGQITPGPFFNTAAYLGYGMMGWKGAALATLGIFLPGFVFAGIGGWLHARIQSWRTVKILMEGMKPAALGLMLAATYQMGRESWSTPWPVAATLLGLVWLSVLPKTPPALLVLGGGALGALMHLSDCF